MIDAIRKQPSYTKRLVIMLILVGGLIGGLVWFNGFKTKMIKQFMAGMSEPPATVLAPTPSAPSDIPSSLPSTVSPPAAQGGQQTLCGKYTVSVPPGTRLGDDCSIVTPNYTLKVKPGKAGSILKRSFAAMKGFPGFLVEDQGGYVAPTPSTKGGMLYLVVRSTEIDGETILCDSVIVKAPRTEADAKEAFAVCKSVAKKM